MPDQLNSETRLTLMRGVIIEAVQREVAQQAPTLVSAELTKQVAPLIQTVQILSGKISIIDNDVKALRDKITQIHLVIYGDEKMKIEGLLTQVEKLTTAIEAWTGQVKAARYALIALAGVSGGDLVQNLLKLLGVL